MRRVLRRYQRRFSLHCGTQPREHVLRQAKSRARELIVEAMATVGRFFDEDPFPAAGRGLYRCTFLSHLR
jgi:hypothetical protein